LLFAKSVHCSVPLAEVWATIGCKHCGREGRYEIDVPDNRVRLDAVEKLLQQGLGRAREAEESRVP
jgi:transcription elongation factor Elf1